MVTTAARSRDFMRKRGYTAEVVEHRRGQFIRIDMFGIADVMAFNDDTITLVQAYRADKEGIDKHAHMDREHPIIKRWMQAGGMFEHHQWTFKTKNGKKYWEVTILQL